MLHFICSQINNTQLCFTAKILLSVASKVCAAAELGAGEALPLLGGDEGRLEPPL